MRELLYELAGYRSEEKPVWVIWGAGNRGLELLKYIKTMEEEIYFADNDVKNKERKFKTLYVSQEAKLKNWPIM